MSSVISIKNADEGIFSGGGIGAPAYRAGNGIYIKDYNISVKYDNKTIQINDDGNNTLGIKFNDKTLEVNSEGLSAIPYTAGDAININDKEISVKYDSNTLRINENGLTADPYTAGSALKIVNRQVSVQVDNDTIKVNNETNQLYVDKDAIGKDDIWKHEIYSCPIDFYQNFDDVSYGAGNLVENYFNFDMTEDLIQRMPQMDNHIFDFTLENTDGTAIEFYIGADYKDEYGQYALILPSFTVDSNGIISVYRHFHNFAIRPLLISNLALVKINSHRLICYRTIKTK